MSVREMCLLSAAAGWLVAALVFWLAGWWVRDPRSMALEELRALLADIRNELKARDDASKF